MSEKYVIAESYEGAIEEASFQLTFNTEEEARHSASEWPRHRVYKITVEEVEEDPKLWVWDVRDAEWSVHADSTHPPYAEVTTCGPNGTVANLYVTATTKTRDALRDEALSWAARAAGKEPQP